MTKIYTYLFSAYLLSPFAPTINYLGNTYEPTKSVDVFVAESAIAREYTIMGKGYVRTYMYSISESIQQKAVDKAKQKGADTVLFKDYFVPLEQSQTRSKKDSSGNVTVSINNPPPLPSAAPEVIVFFLKYK